jgi:multidrug efflux pump subunit AcrA (membrane-fusion protein)
MRRYSVVFLIVFLLSLGLVAPQSSAQDAEKSPTEAKDEAKKESDEAKKESASKDQKAAAKEDKPTKSDAEKKENGKAAEAAEKEKAKAEEKPAAKPEPKKRKTAKVEAKRLKVDLPLDGVFVARKMEEVPLRPEAWTEFEIEDVVELGAKVHKGERLFKFDDEKINDAIRDLEIEQRINDLTILRTEEEMPRMEKTLKLDFSNAERSDQYAKEDFKRYNETDRPMAIKSAEFMVKYYNFMLDYEKDELNELEKMYKADDLTEETEEIVLKRQRNSVEFAQFSADMAKLESEEMIKIRIPRMDIRLKDTLDRAALARARAQMALSLDLNRTRYELDQRKRMRTKSMERHTKLLADKELMEIESPADGVVFYGQCVNGRWSDTQSLINRYKPKNNVSASPALMTIVEPRPLYITSTLDEGKRPDVSDGQKIKVALPAEGSDRVAGQVKSISPIPVTTGKFEINFDVEQDQIPAWVVPGMSCKVQVTVYDKKDALVIPKKAAHADKDDPDQQYVWLVQADDEEAKPARRNVKLGKSKGEEVEVLKGLKKGDTISLEDEEAKEKAEKEKQE